VSNRVYGEQKVVNQDETPLPQGIIKWYSHRKRFGYIRMNGNGGMNGEHKIFFHFASVKKTNPPQVLLEGDSVHFKLVQGARGMKAVEIILVGFKPIKKKKEKNNRKNRNGRPFKPFRGSSFRKTPR